MPPLSCSQDATSTCNVKKTITNTGLQEATQSLSCSQDVTLLNGVSTTVSLQDITHPQTGSEVITTSQEVTPVQSISTYGTLGIGVTVHTGSSPGSSLDQVDPVSGVQDDTLSSQEVMPTKDLGVSTHEATAKSTKENSDPPIQLLCLDEYISNSGNTTSKSVIDTVHNDHISTVVNLNADTAQTGSWDKTPDELASSSVVTVAASVREAVLNKEEQTKAHLESLGLTDTVYSSNSDLFYPIITPRRR